MDENKIDNEIELRSEKVRNIIGQMPPQLLRIGISIISVIILLLLLVAYVVPYKKYETIPAKLYCRPSYQITKMPKSGNFYISTSKPKVGSEQQIGHIENGQDSIIKLYSNVSGEITYNCMNGDYLEQEEVVFSIIPDSIKQIFTIAYIASDKIDKVKINQEALFILDNINMIFKGYVSKIYPLEIANDIKNSSNFKIELTLIDYPLTNEKNTNTFEIGTKGKVKILVSEQPFLRKIFK